MKKNQIKTKTQILKYSTRRHLEGEFFFFIKVFIVDRLELIIIQYGTLFKLAIVITSSII